VRFLAIDLGDKRTGLAVGDDESGLASPVDLIEVPIERRAGDDLLGAIARAVDEHLAPRDELVLGLPLNMDGTKGSRAKMVEAFAARLQRRTGRAVHLFDERLTSAGADWAMSGSGLTHAQKKARRDAIAAAELLKDFLSSRRGPAQVDEERGAE
jgi:putative Holliday junction resolvase